MSFKIDEDPKTFDWDQKNMYLDVKCKKKGFRSHRLIISHLKKKCNFEKKNNNNKCEKQNGQSRSDKYESSVS